MNFEMKNRDVSYGWFVLAGGWIVGRCLRWGGLLLWGLGLCLLGCERHACLDGSECSGYVCDRINLLCLTQCVADHQCNMAQGFVCRKHLTENRNQCLCNPDEPTAYCHFRCYQDEDCRTVPACINKTKDPKTGQEIQGNRCSTCVDPCSECLEPITNPDTGEPTGEQKRKPECTCLDPDFDKKLMLQNEWGVIKVAWQKKFEAWKLAMIAWKKGEGGENAPEYPPLPKASDTIEALFEIQNWKQQFAKWQESKLKDWKDEPRDIWLAKEEYERTRLLNESPYVPDVSTPSTPFTMPKRCKVSTN